MSMYSFIFHPQRMKLSNSFVYAASNLPPLFLLCAQCYEPSISLSSYLHLNLLLWFRSISVCIGVFLVFVTFTGFEVMSEHLARRNLLTIFAFYKQSLEFCFGQARFSHPIKFTELSPFHCSGDSRRVSSRWQSVFSGYLEHFCWPATA